MDTLSKWPTKESNGISNANKCSFCRHHLSISYLIRFNIALHTNTHFLTVVRRHIYRFYKWKKKHISHIFLCCDKNDNILLLSFFCSVLSVFIHICPLVRKHWAYLWLFGLCCCFVRGLCVFFFYSWNSSSFHNFSSVVVFSYYNRCHSIFRWIYIWCSYVFPCFSLNFLVMQPIITAAFHDDHSSFNCFT